MKRLRTIQTRLGAKALKNQDGFLLVTALVLLATLTVLGTTAYLLSSTDIKVGGSFKTSQEVLQVAQAGVERGREILRQANADQTYGADPTVFNSELVYYASGNHSLTSGTIGNYTYTVALSNDAGDAGLNVADSNNKVLITSTATGPNNAKAVVEIAVALPPAPSGSPMSFPSSPGTVALLGNSASFVGGNSNAKSLNGDDQCAAVSNGLPVVAASAAGSVAGIKTSVTGSKPETYHTKVNGVSKDATTNINDIVKQITTAQMTSAGYDLSSPSSLNSLMDSIRDLPQTAHMAGGTTSAAVPGGMGTAGAQKIVHVAGDFTLSSAQTGFGILAVTGNLTFNGNINFTGIILVIGKGTMVRTGGGNGTISGAVWVANTAGADGIPGTADDAMGAAVLNTSGGGNSNLQYCSTAINNALATTAVPPTYSPLIVKSSRQVL